MLLDEIVRNSAPAIGGLLVTAATVLYAHAARRRARRAEPDPRPATRHPAE